MALRLYYFQKGPLGQLPHAASFFRTNISVNIFTLTKCFNIPKINHADYFIHFPLVKSGNDCDAPPCAIDFSERAVTLIHAAAS